MFLRIWFYAVQHGDAPWMSRIALRMVDVSARMKSHTNAGPHINPTCKHSVAIWCDILYLACLTACLYAGVPVTQVSGFTHIDRQVTHSPYAPDVHGFHSSSFTRTVSSSSAEAPHTQLLSHTPSTSHHHGLSWC